MLGLDFHFSICKQEGDGGDGEEAEVTRNDGSELSSNGMNAISDGSGNSGSGIELGLGFDIDIDVSINNIHRFNISSSSLRAAGGARDRRRQEQSCDYFFLLQNVTLNDIINADVSFSFVEALIASESDSNPLQSNQIEVVDRPNYRHLHAPFSNPSDRELYGKFKGFICSACCQSNQITINSHYMCSYKIGVYDFHLPNSSKIQHHHHNHQKSDVGQQESLNSANLNRESDDNSSFNNSNNDSNNNINIKSDFENSCKDSVSINGSSRTNTNNNGNKHDKYDGSDGVDGEEDYDSSGSNSSFDESFDDILMNDVYNVIYNVQRLPLQELSGGDTEKFRTVASQAASSAITSTTTCIDKVVDDSEGTIRSHVVSQSRSKAPPKSSSNKHNYQQRNVHSSVQKHKKSLENKAPNTNVNINNYNSHNNKNPASSVVFVPGPKKISSVSSTGAAGRSSPMKKGSPMKGSPMKGGMYSRGGGDIDDIGAPLFSKIELATSGDFPLLLPLSHKLVGDIDTLSNANNSIEKESRSLASMEDFTGSTAFDNDWQIELPIPPSICTVFSSEKIIIISNNGINK